MFEISLGNLLRHCLNKIFINDLFFILCVWCFAASVCMKVSDPLGLELQIVVSYHVDARN